MAWGLLCLGGAVAAARPSPAVHVEREVWLMGTRLRVSVTAATRSQAARAMEAAFREVQRLEGRISSWRADSEISRLNAATPGQAVELSDEVVDLLAEVRRWVERTERAFDPAVGPLIDAWRLRGSGAVPAPENLDRARAASGIDGFAFDPATRRASRTRAGVWLSAGGFGKGAALRMAHAALKAGGIEAGVLDFGGQVLVFGSATDGRDPSVAVAHPAQRDSRIVMLRLRDRSVATTGTAERFIVVEGVRYGHVLDPRTGRPVEAWGSVTVVHEDPLVADILSTALFVMGPIEGAAWASELEDVGILFLSDGSDGIEAKYNRAMQEFIELSPPICRESRRAMAAAWTVRSVSDTWVMGEGGDR